MTTTIMPVHVYGNPCELDKSKILTKIMDLM
jgi:dTDP-4-amino-4,6-dideoxygalactose transaminase